MLDCVGKTAYKKFRDSMSNRIDKIDKKDESDMKTYKLIFFVVLTALILGPVELDQGPGGTILRLTESQAAPDKIVVARNTKGNNPVAPETKDGPVGSRLTAQEVRQLLTAHNRARAQVGAGPLVWSEKLAIYAQEWADHLASTNRRMEHRPRSGTWKQEHGENLFMGTAGYYGVADAVTMWVKEKSAYHGKPIAMSTLNAYGHYTQIVWKNTKQLGCARVECGGNVIIVCNYDPPGNVLGQKPH
ncbi:MAG: hypothetical protein C0399_01745 [Syntrophus sp. (in: bacteria)]|nr:hypothetical protein [Syntrophus sp. (in: bacteria)]